MAEITQYRTHGQLIESLLAARGWSQRVLAVVLNVSETTLNKIINGNQALEAEMALDLSKIFDVPPEKFLELQQNYNLAQARLLVVESPDLATRAQIFGTLPIPDMIKRGWLDTDDIRDFPKVESSLSKFFGVSSVKEIEIFPHAAKKMNVACPASPAQIAWLYRVKEIAGEMLTARYSENAVKSAVPKLMELRISPPAARKASRILAECGIRFVIVEALPGANIDGVCFWLTDKKPVIGMSFRYDRVDNFWFVLRHELEHVIQKHGQTAMMLDVELEGDRAGTGDNISAEERIANQAAAEFCVPQKSLQSFIARKGPIFEEQDVVNFARTMNVHPGLVAGQLWHKLKLFKRFHNHMVKMRSIVTPGTTVDGWGNIFPVGI